tara:strand:- start:917 stop:1261 length:345 start_codon:yes stop_codon:yes gene_type:complete
MKNIIIALLIIVLVPLSIHSEEKTENPDERICFKTRDIENILFKKDKLIFENRRNVNYSLTCRGSRHLTFQHPLIIEPIKMGFKICSNDVLKLRDYSCFIDKITLLKKDDDKKI